MIYRIVWLEIFWKEVSEIGIFLLESAWESIFFMNKLKEREKKMYFDFLFEKKEYRGGFLLILEIIFLLFWQSQANYMEGKLMTDFQEVLHFKFYLHFFGWKFFNQIFDSKKFHFFIFIFFESHNSFSKLRK